MGRHRRFSKDIEKEICIKYIEGSPTTQLARAYQCTTATACRILERHHIPREHHRTSRYELESPYFFHSIDSEPKAYWLGFIAADGYIKPSVNQLHIKLMSSDRMHLVRFRNTIGSTNPIDDHDYANMHPYVEINIFNRYLVRDLMRFPGFGNNKSHELRWPNNIASDLVMHYIRGYTDGDGGFYVQRQTKRPKPRLFFQVTSNKEFLLALQTQLMKDCDLRQTKLNESHSTPMLTYGGCLQVKRIFDYLYQDATVWLPRKREKIEPYF